jgi:plastocyanin
MHRIKSRCLSIVSVLLIVGFLIVSVSACSSSSVATDLTTSPAATPANTNASDNAITINLTARDMAFDQSSITVPAGASVTINFDNKDSVPHNFALYTDSSASKSVFIGQTLSASSIVYKFTAPTTPGNYFFRCDVHPRTMTGTLVVK